VDESLEPWFAELLDKVKAARDIASQQDRELSDRIIEVQRLASSLCTQA